MSDKKLLFEHLGGNTFKLTSPGPSDMVAEMPRKKQYSAEQLQAIWDDDKDSEYIQFADDGSARYIAHGEVMKPDIVPPTKDRTMSQFTGGDVRLKSIWRDVPSEPPDADKQRLQLTRAWMDQHKFFPNIWHVNERGNIELVDPRTGNFLGGLV